MSFIYLATPYSHPEKAIQQQRFELAELFTARKILEGIPIYSPIVHCHEMARRHEMPTDAGAWRDYNFAMLCKASKVWVLRIYGYTESEGVAEEVAFAKRCGIPVNFVDYEEEK